MKTCSHCKGNPDALLREARDKLRDYQSNGLPSPARASTLLTRITAYLQKNETIARQAAEIERAAPVLDYDQASLMRGGLEVRVKFDEVADAGRFFAEIQSRSTAAAIRKAQP